MQFIVFNWNHELIFGRVDGEGILYYLSYISMMIFRGLSKCLNSRYPQPWAKAGKESRKVSQQQVHTEKGPNAEGAWEKKGTGFAISHGEYSHAVNQVASAAVVLIVASGSQWYRKGGGYNTPRAEAFVARVQSKRTCGLATASLFFGLLEFAL